MRSIVLPIAFIAALGVALPMATTAEAGDIRVHVGDRDHHRDHGWRHRHHHDWRWHRHHHEHD
jgi:Ni/Co efflux regulator RcnB